MKPIAIMTAGLAVAAALAASPAGAVTAFNFSTGGPDGLLGALSQPAGANHVQTETADDFILGSRTRLTGATFTGLLPTDTKLSDVKDVEVEFYHVFPGDSNSTRTVGVTTRTNSPGDVEIGSATREAGGGGLSFTGDIVSSNFKVGNTVIDGIHGGNSQTEFTRGEGPREGEEMTFNVTFDDPILLDAGHFFFRPEVELTNGDFLWLSAPRPIGADGTPFPAGSTDLQAWIRNDALAPDWLRVGTDITHQGPFNMAFSLDGVSGVPEPASWALMISGFGLMGATLRRGRRVAATAA